MAHMLAHRLPVCLCMLSRHTIVHHARNTHLIPCQDLSPLIDYHKAFGIKGQRSNDEVSTVYRSARSKNYVVVEAAEGILPNCPRPR
jgi:hypothetical protein